jgi:sodium/potassium-transporting ATPase subunit alpha
MTVTDYVVAKETGLASKAASVYESNKPLRQLANLGAVCNAAEFDASTVNEPLAERKINGDATDTAILRFAEDMTPVSSLRTFWRSIYQVTFNSKNKFAINVVQSDSAPEEGTVLMIKGAPDILLPRCGSYIGMNGIERLSEQDREDMEILKNNWSSQGKRVILMAKKNLEYMIFNPTEQPREYENDIMGRATSELILVGLVAIEDPPRDEIPECVRVLRGAGIRVFMVTGDFKLTASAIAQKCGIITVPKNKIDDVTNLAFSDEYLESAGIKEASSFDPDRTHAIALSGADLETLDESQWDKLCKYEEVVFARTTPEHKLRIVKELQAREMTVGMTGDGVNDAPSLKAADIGIAMGSGSDIAIEAADMVLLDSFAAIVEAVKYGRVVYDNLKKTIAYLLPAGSFSEFWPVITNVIFGIPQVLSSFLMIIICCCTDWFVKPCSLHTTPYTDNF